jgi:predicted ester cyclase
MAGSGSAAAPVAAKPATPEDQAKRYVECWGLFSTKKWDDFKSCYSKDAVSQHVDSGIPDATGPDQIIAMHAKPLTDAFPDIKGDVELVLVSGKNAATFALLTGTNSGTMKSPAGDMPPTNKKIGMQVAHAVHFADDGKAVDKEWFFADMGEMMGQLGVSKNPVRPASDKPWGALETVIAKDDANEKRNLDIIAKGTEAFNKHDGKAMDAALSDKLVWSEIGVPKDWDKKEAIKMHEELFKGFSNLKITPTASYAAGDYVWVTGTFAGKNDGAVASMGIKKATGKDMSLTFLQLWKLDKDGKITNSWGYWNSMKFAMDLGMIPPPAAAKPDDKKGSGDAKKPDDKKPADKKPADKPKK